MKVEFSIDDVNQVLDECPEFAYRVRSACLERMIRSLEAEIVELKERVPVDDTSKKGGKKK